jgi:hypothetical protein
VFDVVGALQNSWLLVDINPLAELIGGVLLFKKIDVLTPKDMLIKFLGFLGRCCTLLVFVVHPKG